MLRVTEDVGRPGCTINEVPTKLRCDWHTANDTVVVPYGEALSDDPGRFAEVYALGLDETAFVREAPYHRTDFVISIVDVGRGQLSDLVPGKGGDEPKRWLMSQGQPMERRVAFAALDLSGAHKAVFDAVPPEDAQVADEFHVIKVANQRVDETRRRVHNEVLGHRGCIDDPV